MRIFVDCDGVLADFDSACIDACGLPLHKAKDKTQAVELWSKIKEGYPDFFAELPKMPDADLLIQGIRELGFEPTILTGTPKWETAAEQKERWARKHYPGVKVITCHRVEKRLHGNPGDILIDDWDKQQALWEEMGGRFIFHTSAKDSLTALRALVQTNE